MMLRGVLAYVLVCSADGLAAKGFGVQPKKSKDAELRTWLESFGAKVKGVAVAECEGLRGLVATRSFDKGEDVCALPSSMALALADPGLPPPEPEIAVVYGGANLLEWYMSDEKWAAYVRTLPSRGSRFTPTPDMWDDATLDLLEFEPIAASARRRRELVRQVADERSLDVEALEFATWLAASRAFTLNVNNATLRVLCPIMDMINHDAEPAAEITVRDVHLDEGTFAIVATKPIKKGDQITIKYGGPGVTLAELLLDYGFVSDQVTEADVRIVGATLAKYPDSLQTPALEDAVQQDKRAPDYANRQVALNFRSTLRIIKEKL